MAPTIVGKRSVAATNPSGFAIGPALAYPITAVIPLERPGAIGLLLMGMAPCAPLLPMFLRKDKRDLGLIAAVLLLASAAAVPS